MPCANRGIVPQTMLKKLLDLLKLEPFRPHQEISIQSIIQDQKDAVICTHIDYHNQHESAALIGLFHTTASVLTSVESYRNYQKPTQRGVQGVPLLSAAESNLKLVFIRNGSRYLVFFVQVLSINQVLSVISRCRCRQVFFYPL